MLERGNFWDEPTKPNSTANEPFLILIIIVKKDEILRKESCLDEEFYEMFGAASFLVACKEVSKERKCRDILNCFFYIHHDQKVELQINKTFWDLKDSLVKVEILLLRCLGFQTSIPNVFDDLCDLAQENKVHDRKVLQTSIALLNSAVGLDEVHELIDGGRDKVRILSGTVLALAAKLVYPLALDDHLQPFLSENLKISTNQDTQESMRLLFALKKEFAINYEQK